MTNPSDLSEKKPPLTKVSVLGVTTLWGNCRDIPTDQAFVYLSKVNYCYCHRLGWQTSRTLLPKVSILEVVALWGNCRDIPTDQAFVCLSKINYCYCRQLGWQTGRTLLIKISILGVESLLSFCARLSGGL